MHRTVANIATQSQETQVILGCIPIGNQRSVSMILRVAIHAVACKRLHPTSFQWMRFMRTTCRSNHSMTVSEQVALRRRHPVSARSQDKPRVATGQLKKKHMVKVVVEIGMCRIAGILQSDQTGQIRPVSELCWQLQTDRRHKQRCRFAASLTASGSRRRIAGCRAWLGTTHPTIRRSDDPTIRRFAAPRLPITGPPIAASQLPVGSPCLPAPSLLPPCPLPAPSPPPPTPPRMCP